MRLLMGLSQGTSLHSTHTNAPHYQRIHKLRLMIGEKSAVDLSYIHSMASNLANISVGGYDLDWLEDPPDDLKCLICLGVARDPRQHPGDDTNDCGKIFCHDCIIEYQKSETTCPNCRRDLTLFKDSRSARDIKALKVKCSNLVNGCRWVGELGSLDAHLQSCDYALLHCTNECKKKNNQIVKILKKKLEEHLTNDCPRRQYKCLHCQETGEHQERTTTHLETCAKVEVPCPNDKCQISVSRCELLTHRSDCNFEYVPCKYDDFGCQMKLFRKDLKEHEQDDKLHLSLTKNKVLELNSKVKHLESRALMKFSSNASDHKKNLLKSLAIVPCTFQQTCYLQYKSNDDDFYSPSFYTSYTGYKMCLRVDANGHTNGKDTHVSVFSYLMKGDNDDSLSWPFTGTVTYELLNQLEDKNHHKKTISFPANSVASQRVVDGEKGKRGLGNSQFISHADLDCNADENTQYLKDDTLVFRVSAEVPDYKPWLECTLVSQPNTL